MESSPRLQQKFKSKFHMLALSSAEKYKDDLDIGI
jgi:hypothetical protein